MFLEPAKRWSADRFVGRTLTLSVGVGGRLNVDVRGRRPRSNNAKGVVGKRNTTEKDGRRVIERK